MSDENDNKDNKENEDKPQLAPEKKKDEPKGDDLAKKLADAEAKAQEEAAKTAQLQKEIEELKKGQQEDKKKELESKGDYENLYKQQVKANEELKQSQEKAKERAIEAEKKKKVLEELNKLGLKDEYKGKVESMIDTKPVFYDEQTGKVLAADSVAQAFMKDWAVFFDDKKGMDTPSGKKVEPHSTEAKPAGKLTMEEWKKLPYAEKLKRQGDIEGF